MSELSCHIKAKRLLHLYLLNVEIPEHCHRAISRMFEFLDFDDSKDRCMYDEPNFTNITEKYNKNNDPVCKLSRVVFDGTVIIEMGWDYMRLLNNLRLDCFMGDSQTINDIEDFLIALTKHILETKDVIFHKFYIGHSKR